MNKVTLISIDLAKDVFQVAGFDKNMKVLSNKQLNRRALHAFIANSPSSEIVMEACYSSHYWARSFQQMGHRVRLLPAQHVAPFVRGNKSDRNDVIAIAEASRRPGIKDVPVKSLAQQDIQSLHRMRDLKVRRRTSMMNQARGLLSDYGIVCPKGHAGFKRLLAIVCDPQNAQISQLLKPQFESIRSEYQQLTQCIGNIERSLKQIAKEQPLCQLLLSIPGIGIINATALYSAIGNGSQFSSAREFAVWLGLTPRQSSSGMTFHSGGITKRGNGYLRKQLVHGARVLLNRKKDRTDKLSRWADQLQARRGKNKATVALAARLARLCWILLQKNEPYRAR